MSKLAAVRDKKRIKRKVTPGKGQIMSARTVRKLEDSYQVMTMRRDGYTLREIGESMGLGQPQVSEILKKNLLFLVSIVQATTEEDRQLQIERLDQLLKSYTPFAVGYTAVVKGKDGEDKEVPIPPNPVYGQMVLQIEARRSKLLALDVPEVKVMQHTGIREYVGVDMDKV